MPLTITDITVPVISKRREDGGLDYYCELCGETVGTDYNLRPQPDLLGECLMRLKERIVKLEGALK